jgi:hypothetical protein
MIEDMNRVAKVAFLDSPEIAAQFNHGCVSRAKMKLSRKSNTFSFLKRYMRCTQWALPALPVYLRDLVADECMDSFQNGEQGERPL